MLTTPKSDYSLHTLGLEVWDKMAYSLQNKSYINKECIRAIYAYRESPLNQYDRHASQSYRLWYLQQCTKIGTCSRLVAPVTAGPEVEGFQWPCRDYHFQADILKHMNLDPQSWVDLYEVEKVTINLAKCFVCELTLFAKIMDVRAIPSNVFL